MQIQIENSTRKSPAKNFKLHGTQFMFHILIWFDLFIAKLLFHWYMFQLVDLR